MSALSYNLLYNVAKLLRQQNKITIRHHQNIFSLDTPKYLFKACLQKGQSYIFVDSSKDCNYPKTPLNLALEKHASNATILDAFLENEDRILKIALECAHSYKKTQAFLQLEFTGKHSNAILLDSQGRVLEALHFLTPEQSYRPVRKHQTLAPLKKTSFVRPPLEEIDTPTLLRALQDIHTKYSAQRLEQAKAQLHQAWCKKQDNLEMILAGLPSATQLEQNALEQRQHANLLLTHLYTLKSADLYAPQIFLENQCIVLPPRSRSFSDAANKLFKMAKKSAQKATHIVLQRENLTSKITFLKAKIHFLQEASLEELELLRPKTKRQTSKNIHLESFEIEGLRVVIGRNQQENRDLLKMARARDIWAHVYNVPGPHMVVFSHPFNPSETLLIKACTLLAKLVCPNPSSQSFKVRVDYTQRKNVKFAPKTPGAHVFYTHFETITIAI
ncbi:NFACT family protein [Helicobacter felis]|uniref:Fibronectin/fibrinogen-binding protein n=1 Tax=Helicobacter felis (strain ATCC 49179 / CCUG 28539 / NCTC 12436 / CS1) TaxID=936155 RepID=E7A8P7_HELFC|nr:NFACT family protein [Helicobacter felis]CBY82384.1 fibronectin/fibrinogen-binding protein [Helicobacter felis ATCC 49179]